MRLSDKFVSQLKQQESLEQLTKRLSEIDTPKPSAELGQLADALNKVISVLEQEKAEEWVFEYERDKNGYIIKIHAKKIIG